MNEDEMQALEPTAGEELEQMLGRYARVRLDPNLAQTRRARAVVMEAAWRRRLGSAGGDSGRTRKRHRLVPFSGWSARRVGISLAAAVLAGLLIGSSAFAASRAGGPLYDARINMEQLFLPSQPDARAAAELAQAQARLAEVVEASGRGDQGAVAAALNAYDRTIQDLGLLSGPAAERALTAVEFHRTVLQDLLASASGPAVDGLQNALSHSTGVIDRLTTDTTPGPAGPANGNTGAGGNGSGNGNGNAGGNGNGNAGGNGGQKGNGGGNGAGPSSAPVSGADATVRPQPTPKGPDGTPNPPGH